MDAEGPNFEGCNSTVPIAEPKVCGFPKDRGSGKNYTMFWFFDMEYGGCSRYALLQKSVSDSKTVSLKVLNLIYRVSHMYLNGFARLFRGHWVT